MTLPLWLVVVLVTLAAVGAVSLLAAIGVVVWCLRELGRSAMEAEYLGMETNR